MLEVYPDIFCIYCKKFPETIICEPARENCWCKNCKKCKDGLEFQKKKTLRMQKLTFLKYVSWCEWKNERGGHILELIFYVCTLAPTFLEHCYV